MARAVSIKEIDRKTLAGLFLIGALVIVIIWGFFYVHGRLHAAERRLESRKKDLERFSVLARRYLNNRVAIESAVSRTGAPLPGGGVITMLEAMVKRVGAELKAVKPVGEDKRLGYRERLYSLGMERMDLNQIVNLLYLVENSGALVVIKEFSMHTRFDDPEAFDVEIKLAHVTRAAGP